MIRQAATRKYPSRVLSLTAISSTPVGAFDEAKVRAFIERDHDRSDGRLSATIHGTRWQWETRSLIRSST
jgi:hypothetical protein